MSHLTYFEAAVSGLLQGITELFPISSLGHNVLLPAVIGGSWAKDLNVGSSTSPYLAFIVGLHVATAIALFIYFWRDWVRIIKGFFSSLRDRRVETPDERLAWMIIAATIPVGLVGLAFDKEFKHLFAKPVLAGIFLFVNGLILLAGERFRRRKSVEADAAIAADREYAERTAVGRHSSGGHALRQRERAAAAVADRRLSTIGYVEAVIIGCAQILALLAGISRDGVTMVAGMTRGLSREDAARFAFLLATPIILAAGALKLKDLTGPLGNGIHGQILVGSVLAGVSSYVCVRFLVRYFRTRTLTPFAIYCLVAGLASVAYLGVIK